MGTGPMGQITDMRGLEVQFPVTIIYPYYLENRVQNEMSSTDFKVEQYSSTPCQYPKTN